MATPPPTVDRPAEQTDAPSSVSPEMLRPEYVFSPAWFFGGLGLFAILCAAVAGLYYYQIQRLPNYIIEAANSLDADNKTAEAVQLLDGFRRNNPYHDGVWKTLDKLNQKLILTEGTNFKGYAGAIRISQDVKNQTPKRERLAISDRILRWQWESRDMDGAMNEARDMLKLAAEIQADDRECKSAWQYFALGSLFRINELGYRVPADMSEVLKNYDTIDKLLEKAYMLDPANIEVAEAYAQFLRRAGTGVYAANSSKELEKESQQSRENRANGVIDDMVNRNRDNADAYLIRFQYQRLNRIIDPTKAGFDADLKKAIELDPASIRARELAGKYEYTRALLARREGKEAEAQAHRAAAIDHYTELSRRNEKVPDGFRYLGDLYLGESEPAKALEAFKEGVERIQPFVDSEIEGRYIMALNNQGRFDEAAGELTRFARFFRENRPDRRTASIIDRVIALLRAKLNATEGDAQKRQAEQARATGDQARASVLLREGQAKIDGACQDYQTQLITFGDQASDYMFNPESFYPRIVGDSLMTLGRLMMIQSKWDEAAKYYRKATGFPALQDRASIDAATALQQMNLSADALDILTEATERSPDNETIRFLYTKALFTAQMAREAGARNFDQVDGELARLEEKKADLPQPWAVDLLRIQIQYARDSISGDTDRVLAAQQVALRQYRELEHKEFPPREGLAEGETAGTEPKTYDQDTGFLGALAGIYSAMSAVHDFERVTTLVRDLPGGEAIHYAERINDALRRNDREGAQELLKQAVASDLPESQKQRFIQQAEQLKAASTTDSETIDSLIARLEKSFQDDPDSLGPQACFILANRAIDREDWKTAKTLEDRLRASEKAEFGTLWRFVKARRFLEENADSPDLNEARKLQEEIVHIRPQWDMAYVLGAMIEDKTPGSTEPGSAKRLKQIEYYKQAVQYGNAIPGVWEALIGLLGEEGKFDEAQSFQRDALTRGIRIQTAQSRFPQPYQRFYNEVFKAIDAKDFEEADRQARTCVLLAQKRQEKPELIFDLNMAFGKMFLDSDYTNLAEKYLRAVHSRGGIYVYPLAVCFAKAGHIDEAFTLLLDEIDRTPSSIAALLPSILILLEQVQPSEEVYERIDDQMTRVENGERVVLEATLDHGDGERIITLGEKRIHSLILKFPGQTQVPDPSTIRILAPQVDDVLLNDMAETGALKPDETSPAPATPEAPSPPATPVAEEEPAQP